MSARGPAGLAWSRPDALRGAVTAAPAAVAALSDVQLAAALAVGLLPVCSVALPPRRPARVRLGLYGVLAAASIFCGGVLAQWPVVAVAALVLAGGGVGHLIARTRRPEAMLALVLCLPLLAVGFSYPGADAVARLAVDILAGTAWAVLVALAWPARRAPASASASAPAAGPAPAAAPPGIVAYGWAAGAVGGVCAAIGFAAGLEHVGWAPAAALLVMRPSAAAQRLRSLDRLVDVVLGALAASALVLLDPPPWVWALVIAGVVVGATATFGSRWYVLPTFTTLLVFVMLLARDPQDAGERFWERVSETALGVGVAALVALVVLPAVLRRRAAAGSDRLRQGRQ